MKGIILIIFSLIYIVLISVFIIINISDHIKIKKMDKKNKELIKQFEKPEPSPIRIIKENGRYNKLKMIKFFFWKIINWKKYQERKFEVFAILADKMDKQEKFRQELMNFVEKHKEIPKKYTIAYIAMSKIKKPWYQDKNIIMKMKKATRNIVRNEILSEK